MSVSPVSGSIPQYRTPQTKTEGELRESITAKAKEAEAQVIQARIIRVSGLDFEVWFPCYRERRGFSAIRRWSPFLLSGAG
jgi:hypothetical protein